MRVIVHAGFHKTGTTSLQSVLALNREALLPYFRVEILGGGNRDLREIADSARAFSLNADPAELAVLRGLVAVWAGGMAFAPGQGLVISTEDLSGHMPGHRDLRDYAAAAPLAGAMADGLRMALGKAVALDFLYTTRAPAAWLKSLHWQLSKHAHLRSPLEVFARNNAPAADFAPVLVAVRKAVAPAVVHEIALEDTARRALGPADALLDLTDLPADLRAALAPAPPQNRRSAYDLAPAFVALNQAGLPAPLLRRMKDAMRRLADGPAQGGDEN